MALGDTDTGGGSLVADSSYKAANFMLIIRCCADIVALRRAK